MLRSQLHELGYLSVQEADTGPAALEQLRAGAFEVLITDWWMPGMSGIELLRQVRADQALGGLRVIVVTAENRPEQEAEAMRAGADAFVLKPFASSILQSTLEAVLGARRVRQAGT